MLLYQTHARIHLQNIRHNILGIRQRVGEERKILIAVKANGYGHGAVEVSRMAADAGVSHLGVATVPEGLELRQAGIPLPILKFSPAFPEEMEAALGGHLTLAVCTADNALALQATAQRMGVQCHVHMKVDTGMGRIGVSVESAPGLARLIREQCPSLHLEGVFTHLPVSDAPAFDSFTQKQLALFRETVACVEEAWGSPVSLVHAANSGGVLGHQESWLSMVRPGIMIYGFLPDQTTPPSVSLRPGLSLLSRVSFLKRVTAGTSIGYGCTWKAPHDTWIATFPAGYADGFNRLFSNKGRVLIGGRSYPVVGRVCMDQSMCDLGPETRIQVGDSVTLIGRDGGESITVEEWAEKLGTITYEVTCQINARVQRLYERD